MSHTPAPWTTGGIFDPNGPDPRTNIWGKRPRGTQSGEIVAAHVRLRDADLIAAAPDLLTALAALWEWVYEDNRGDGQYPEEMVRAAMTKAKGGGRTPPDEERDE